MSKEQKLYDKFVDVLNDRLDGEPTPKDLEVVFKFIQSQGLQASIKHQGLNSLVNKTAQLPFEQEDELPLIKRVK